MKIYEFCSKYSLCFFPLKMGKIFSFRPGILFGDDQYFVALLNELLSHKQSQHLQEILFCYFQSS